MATKDLPTPQALRQLLRYDPDTGKLFWRSRPLETFATKAQAKTWNTRFAGNEAFTAKAAGYPHGRIDGKAYLAHRVIWAMQTGAWPTAQVDHVSGDRADNRWANLREATGAQNQWNKAKRKDCASGLKGVRKARNGWTARIQANGIVKRLGTFSTPESAHAAYCEASAHSHGAFGRT